MLACHAHDGVRPAARCTRCGVLLCALCQQSRNGRALCSNCLVGGGEVVKALRIVRLPVPPAMPVLVPHLPSPPPIPSPPAPPAARKPRPAVAGVLGLVGPGMGHLYAGKPLRGLLFLALAPAAIVATAKGAIPFALYAFLHGLAAFDGYRWARIKSDAWSKEDAREARGVWAACAGALLLLGFAHAAGAPFSPVLAWPAVLVPLGVGLALGERSNRIDAAAGLAEPAPGVSVDRRADRAALAEQLSA